MKPVMCSIKDDPARGQYGDCVRACVASILELDDVPHFFEGGPDHGEAAYAMMRGWLKQHGRIPAYFALPGNSSFGEVLDHMREFYPGIDAMLMCQCGEGNDHCLVMNNDGIRHDPAWYRAEITGPHSSGFWVIIILARL